MSALDVLKSWLSLGRKADPSAATRGRKTAYQGAVLNRLTSDWPTSILSADAATQYELCKLRARSRDLERNGGIAERYLSACEMNILGSDGVGLQMKARKTDARTATGLRTDLDQPTNLAVEQEWKEFGKRGNFDVTGKHSRNDFWRVALRSVARDGDAIVLVYRGATVPNKWKIAFQLIEGDYVDDQYNVKRSGDGSYRIPPDHSVRMGIELDAFKRKVAIWMFATHPGDYGVEGVYNYDGRRLRIPILGTEPGAPVHAIHLTRTKRPEETRGAPWMAPAMIPIKMLEGYEEAELVAARAQACKHVFYEREMFGPDGEALQYPEDITGQLVEDMEPGGSTELPLGVKANFYNPTHPSQSCPDLTKSIKRKISAALDCAYNTLFVDLESVNYSSIRAGMLDEREGWKMKQSWLADDLATPSFEVFLSMALTVGAIPGIGMADFARVNAPELKFRRWPWVDPQKDIRANVEAIAAKLTTRSKVIADQSNGDFEETMDEYSYEQKYMMARGIDPAPIAQTTEQLIDPNVGDNTDTGNPNTDSRPAQPVAPRAPAPRGKAASAVAPQTINVHVDAPDIPAAPEPVKSEPINLQVHVDAKSGPVSKTFEIDRGNGVVIKGKLKEEAQPAAEPQEG